jgi:hypothetical protein
MVADVVTAAIYFVEHQIPLFLLVFGIMLVGLGFVMKGLGQLVALPTGVLAIAAGMGWFTMASGSILALPLDVMEVMAFGLVFVVLAKAFSVV